MKRHFEIGIDEAGRGPLAGPVAVGIFAVPASFDRAHLHGIRDSKLLSASQRAHWYRLLTALPQVRWAVAMSGPTYIDQHGIVRAVYAALTRALRTIHVSPTRTAVLLDGGLHAPNTYEHQTTIIHGDATEPLIAAAAILAKVTRDRYMERQAVRYPGYHFERHKGYGTVVHRAAILKHGLSPLHRTSFCRNIPVYK